jgi:hypothetical protein
MHHRTKTLHHGGTSQTACNSQFPSDFPMPACCRAPQTFNKHHVITADMLPALNVTCAVPAEDGGRRPATVAPAECFHNAPGDLTQSTVEMLVSALPPPPSPPPAATEPLHG